MIYLGNSPVGVAVNVFGIKEVTIETATTTTGGSYDALQEAIGSLHKRWIAWVDDYAYMTGGGDKVMCAIASPGNAQGSTNEIAIYRNDATYMYMRKLSYGSTTGKIPAGTKFKVAILPES